jgi:2-polyprenyl-6-methoxyphenol hydroxylase-like FAD-dependent oxidoreductase
LLIVPCVQYGKILKDISYDDDANTITAVFEDGSTATGSMVIGADGAQSVVRRTIFGEEKAKPSSVPYSAVNLHVCYGDAEKALFVRQKHPIMTHAIHPDGYWLWISSAAASILDM